MAEPIALPGMGYSPAHAKAIAIALRASLDIARANGASVPDLLAGMAQAAADVVRASKLRDNPDVAAAAIAAYLIAAAKTPPTA